ncbi:MAG: hypothetical protein P1V97_37055, partial [Planctomycetota bacterium]|nr:hypothetical protein [Planctomycetota bacterium]
MAEAIFQNRLFTRRPELCNPFFEAYPQWKQAESLQFYVLLWSERLEDKTQIEEALERIEAKGSWRHWGVDQGLNIPRLWLKLGFAHRARRALARSQTYGRTWRGEYRFERLILWAEIFVAFKRPSLAREAYERTIQVKDGYSGYQDRLEKLRADLSHLLDSTGLGVLINADAA